MGKWIAIVTLVVAGCGKPTFKEAAYTTIRTADLAYGLAVEACDAREKAIISRPCTPDQTPEQCEAQDREDMSKVRAACDRIFDAFESARDVAPAVKQLEKLGL